MKAVEEHGLDYPTLKRMVRNSLEYAFADAATKARLKADLEGVQAFEQRSESSERRSRRSPESPRSPESLQSVEFPTR